MFYDNATRALKKASLWRARSVASHTLLDFASNDYLGLRRNKKQAQRAFAKLCSAGVFAPGASMLVNGYHALHHECEELLCAANGFERGAILGSGFLANIALLESLVRTRDVLFIDSHYHASGQLATRLLGERVRVFAHNRPDSLRELLLREPRTKDSQWMIAIESVYSMSGEIAPRAFAELATEHDALLLVDEAHGSGTIGKNLLGYFDYHNLPIAPNYIKMGTFSKAYGSYGAYILAHSDIIDFLTNRAKPLIYSTALSLFDTALAFVNFCYILRHSTRLVRQLQKRQEIWSAALGRTLRTSIVSIPLASSAEALAAQRLLAKEGFCVAAIRPPTVSEPMLRINVSLATSKKAHKRLSAIIAQKFCGALT